MNRGKKAAYNSLSSLVAEIVALVCGFVLPRLVLKNFGSAYNGLVQSVTQFLSIVALMRAGVGGATRATLYKILKNKDNEQLNATIRATEIFMHKVALLFAAFVIAFSCVYPLVVKNEFNWGFSASLVLIISISTFVEYYFGITYQILLQADQKQYIPNILSAGTTILNTIISVLLINQGFGIHVVKLGSAVAYCVAPVIIYKYVRKHYHIDKKVKPDFSSINQRWDAVMHQVAAFIYTNTDIMLITFFLSLKDVSVYATYCLVSTGLKKMMSTITSGVEAAFGDMIAREDKDILIENIKIYETLLHGTVSIIFGAAMVLVTPFIQVYTKGIYDIDYSRYTFGYLLIATETVYLLRQPYHSIVDASGHFKQTRHIAFIQAAINLGLSIIFIIWLGLPGVLIGTLVSDIYRSIAYRTYVKGKMLPEIRVSEFIKRYAVTILTMATVFLLSRWVSYRHMTGYIDWIIYALPITGFAIVVTMINSFLFYRIETKKLINKLRVIMNGIIHKQSDVH